VSDLYDDIESLPPPDRSRLERFLVLSLFILMFYTGLAYLLLPANIRRGSPTCRW
jgi:hypothetical protein